MDEEFDQERPGESARGNGSGRGPRRIAHAVRRRASSAIEDRQRRAIDQLSGVATFIRRVVSELDEQGHTATADYARRAAAHLDQLATRVEHADVDEVRRAVERYARRHPALFMGAAAGVGLVAGRILHDVVDAETAHDLDEVGEIAQALPEHLGHRLAAIVRARPLMAGVMAGAAGMAIGLALMPPPER
jgi:hypothetical protein